MGIITAGTTVGGACCYDFLVVLLPTVSFLNMIYRYQHTSLI